MTTFLLLHGNREVSSIAILISFRGSKYRKSIGESVLVKLWNSRTKRVRVTQQNTEGNVINDRLDEWAKAAERTVNHFKKFKSVPTASEFLSRLDQERWGKRDLSSTMLVPYFDRYVERYTGVRTIGQIKHYKTCKKTFAEFEAFIGKPIRFDDVDMNFYHRFIAWFNTKGYSINYLGEKIKMLKIVLNEARDIDHLHTNSAYLAKGFVTPQSEADTIYLTEDELLQIYRADISPETVAPIMEDKRPHNVARKVAAMKKARDMFLIGAFTGLRFSDYSRLKPQSISDGMIRSRNKKTGISTAVPVHWVVQEIIDNGYDFEHPLFEQKLNDQIKDVARIAGIDEEVLISRNAGGRIVETAYKKYQLIASHTARRSFATNAYKAGIPTLAIMKVTGHKRESTFLRYIRISEKENAEMLKQSAFFSRKTLNQTLNQNGSQDNESHE